jgi:hypothetical protein
MAGNSRNNQDAQQRRAETIRTWMLSNAVSRALERYDDLHIDRIDPVWKAPGRWVEGGLEAFRIAVDLRDRYQPELALVLAYSLVPTKTPSALHIESLEELISNADGSPPSLYLFERGKEPWVDAGHLDISPAADKMVIKPLRMGTSWVAARARHCYYMEFRQFESNEYFRSAFVEG